jgi:non-ribosomal peptide synthetase component F
VLALAEDVTLFMLLLTIFYILLAKTSGQEDIVIGSPIAGRKHEDLQPLLGIFVNMLALRNFPEEEKTFVEFLQEVKERTLTAFENQDFQYEDLVELVVDKRHPGRNPLFDVVFVMRNVETAEMPLPGLKLKPYKMKHKTSVFDLALAAVEKDREITLTLHYSDWLFNQSEALEFLQNYVEVLRQVMKNKHLRLKEITLGHDLLIAESTIPEELQGDFGF